MILDTSRHCLSERFNLETRIHYNHRMFNINNNTDINFRLDDEQKLHTTHLTEIDLASTAEVNITANVMDVDDECPTTAPSRLLALIMLVQLQHDGKQAKEYPHPCSKFPLCFYASPSISCSQFIETE
jgi:hypothetical protein